MWWSYVIDGVLILMVLISIIVGISKGFFDSVLSLISTGLALAASVFLSKYVANFINKLFNFEDFVLQHLDGAAEGSVKIFGVIELSNVEIAKFCVWISAVIIVYIVIKLVVRILSKMFEAVVKNSIAISGLNRLLGLVFGAVKGGVMVLVALALCTLLSQLPIIGSPIYNAIQDTYVTKTVYNVVEDFVEKNLTQEKIEDIIDKIISDNVIPEDEGSDSGTAVAVAK